MKKFRAGVCVITGILTGMLFQKKRMLAEYTQLEQMGKKYAAYYQLLNQWLSSSGKGKRVSDYLMEEGVHTVAVYGLGALADRLADDLSGSDVQVLYGIDQDACCTNSRMEHVYSPDGGLPEVDAVVITPFCSAHEIAQMLRQKCPYRIIPLDEIIFSL